jgi:hypothetical protein
MEVFSSVRWTVCPLLKGIPACILIYRAVSAKLSSGGTTRRVVALPNPIPPNTELRSTLLQSSLAGIDRLGLRDRYYENLAPEHHQAVKNIVIGTWVPIDLGLAHYDAINRLELSSDQSHANGRLIADRVQSSFGKTVFRSLGNAVSPLSALERSPAFFERLLKGGGVAVDQLGPKDARVEIHGSRIGQFAYVRHAWAGMFEGTLGLLTRKVYARDVTPRNNGDLVVIAISWV